MTTALVQLLDLKTKLAKLQAGEIRVTELTDVAQASLVLTSSLPAKFGEVLNNIINRLESSALFTEESCSFSQTGLFENLEVWIQKAEERLTKQGRTSP